MWKVVVRGIRESFERRACRTNVYSQSSQDASNTSTENNKVAIRQKNCCVSPNFYVFFHGFCNKNAKHLGAKDKENSNKYDPRYTWTEAVGLSSILAVGYVVCQSLCIRRKLFEIDNKNIEKWRTILVSSPAQLSQLFENTFALPPPWEHGILPISSSKHEPYEIDQSSEKIIDNISNVQQTFGPLTAEDTYKEAENEFLETHNSVMSELELNSGILALEEERYEDAFEHFTEGAKLSSASSLFNLALCYELGLGTTIDYEKAAKLYKDAADRGHTDAMYNLGVFHAQGKGGVTANLNTARQLFSAASKKGHVLATEALELENSIQKYPQLQENMTDLNNHLEVKTLGRGLQSYEVINLMNHNIFLDINDKNVESNQFLNSSDSLNLQNPTDIFLNMLGINEQNAVSLISIRENCS